MPTSHEEYNIEIIVLDEDDTATPFEAYPWAKWVTKPEDKMPIIENERKILCWDTDNNTKRAISFQMKQLERYKDEVKKTSPKVLWEKWPEIIDPLGGRHDTIVSWSYESYADPKCTPDKHFILDPAKPKNMLFLSRGAILTTWGRLKAEEHWVHNPISSYPATFSMSYVYQGETSQVVAPADLAATIDDGGSIDIQGLAMSESYGIGIVNPGLVNMFGGGENTLEQIEEILNDTYSQVVVDPGGTHSGISYPVGTSHTPVNNIEDAITIAEDHELSHIQVADSVLTLDSVVEAYNQIANLPAPPNVMLMHPDLYDDLIELAESLPARSEEEPPALDLKWWKPKVARRIDTEDMNRVIRYKLDRLGIPRDTDDITIFDMVDFL